MHAKTRQDSVAGRQNISWKVSSNFLVVTMLCDLPDCKIWVENCFCPQDSPGCMFVSQGHFFISAVVTWWRSRFLLSFLPLSIPCVVVIDKSSLSNCPSLLVTCPKSLACLVILLHLFFSPVFSP